MPGVGTILLDHLIGITELKNRVAKCSSCLILVLAMSFGNHSYAKSNGYYQLELASKLASSSHPRRALPYLNRAIKKNPNNARAYFLRGKVFYVLENLDIALSDFNKSILLKKDSASVYFSRSRVYFEKGNLDLAVKDLSKYIALVKEPRYKGDGYRNRAKAYIELKKLDKAMLDLNHALKCQKNSSNYWLRGNTYMKQKKYELAVSDYTNAIKLDNSTDLDRLYSLRATAYEKLGKDKLAKQDRKFVSDRVKDGWGAFLDSRN